MNNPPDISYALKQTKSKNRAEQECGTIYLINKFQPLINKLSQEICPNCEMTDMYQAGNLAIILAIKTYQPTKSQFCTWVFFKVRDQLQKERSIEFPIKISRHLMNKGHKATYIQHSEVNNVAKEEGYELQADNITAHDRLIHKEDAELITEAFRHINKRFPKLHCRLFTDYYYLDIPLNKLSKQFNVNAEAIVRNMILSLRNYYNTYR